jgi:hypothetical protein
MAADGVALSLAKTTTHVRRVLDADGVLARIGADRLHATIDQAVEAHRRDGRSEGVA